ncbi:MAG: hypothetical protein AB1805_17100 [Nitrospirota bacterium]
MAETDIDLILARVLGALEEPSIQQLTLYIPNKDKNGRQIKNLERWVEEAQRILARIGGGSTALPPADGTWLNPENSDIIQEKTKIVYAYIYPDKFEDNIGSLREFLHRFGRETNQGEVVVEFDGRFYRIRKYDAR